MTDEELLNLLRSTPAEGRAEILDRVCAGDAGRRERIQALLTPSEFTEVYVPHSDASGNLSASGDQPGASIADRYRLVHLIGEGGMGAVYRAAQSKPIRRSVALKLIKKGMDSKSVLQRFEAERQALALMDHPNIARVYDGGTTASGQPFFVMELVNGISITRYCDEHRLDVKSRLELFVSVCQAVQHAHQKGIIHRDIKPSNILVMEIDGRPTPKVIDFGVAKAIEQKLTDASIVDAGLIVGTPNYMSPEQADPSSMDIDTRTDVYALGVILYELLVGSTPIDAKHFQQGAFLEMMRMVRELEPPRPSTKLSTADALPNIAANRDIEPSRLGKLLKGELDWVVMKALEKDRTRRYETANGLARDVQRYLFNEPVEARPPSAAYRLRKLIRRNRAAVFATSAIAIALIVGVIGFAWQAQIAKQQRDRAMSAETESKKRADELQKVADYQSNILHQFDGVNAGARLMTDLRQRHDATLVKQKTPEAESLARKTAFERELAAVNATDAAVAMLDANVLAPAVKTIDTQFADQPVVDAALRTTLGNIYSALGQYEQAQALYQRAYELRRLSLGEDHRDTLLSRGGMARMQGDRQKFAEAESTIRDVLKRFERTIGPDQKETLDTKALLAVQLNHQGRYDECVALTRELLEQRRRVFGPEHVDTLDSMDDLGRYLMNCGKYADAVKILRETLAIQRKVADPSIGSTLTNLGVCYNRQHDYASAEPVSREVLELNRRTKGEDHPATITAIANLATILMETPKLSEAESLAKEALEKTRRILGNEQAQTLKSMNLMGQVLFRQNKFTETEPLYREALTTGRRVLGEEHPDTIIWIANMGFLMQRMGRFEEAEQYLREAVDKNRRQLGATHPYTISNSKIMIALLRQRNKPAEAENYLNSLLEAVRKQYGEEHLETITIIGLLGSTLRDQGKLAEAEAYFQQTIDVNQKRHGIDHADTVTAIMRMASLRTAQGKNAEAIELLLPIENKVLKVIQGTTGTLRNASLRGVLGKARTALAKSPAEFKVAEANLLDAHGTFAKMRGEKDKETRDWVEGLVALYIAWNKAEPDQGYDVKATEWQKKLGAASK